MLQPFFYRVDFLQYQIGKRRSQFWQSDLCLS